MSAHPQTPSRGTLGQLFVGSDIYAIRVEAIEPGKRPTLIVSWVTEARKGEWIELQGFNRERATVRWDGDGWRLVKDKNNRVRWAADFNHGAREYRDPSF